MSKQKYKLKYLWEFCHEAAFEKMMNRPIELQ